MEQQEFYAIIDKTKQNIFEYKWELRWALLYSKDYEWLPLSEEYIYWLVDFTKRKIIKLFTYEEWQNYNI